MSGITVGQKLWMISNLTFVCRAQIKIVVLLRKQKRNSSLFLFLNKIEECSNGQHFYLNF